MLKKIDIKSILRILLIVLLVVFLIFIRYTAIEIPDWLFNTTFLIPLFYPLLVLRLIVDGNWLMDAVLAAITYLAVILVPCQGERARLRRYLIRPAVAVLAFVCSCTVSIGIFNNIADVFRFTKYADNYSQVRELIDQAEHVLVSDGGGHTTEYFADRMPVLSWAGDGTYDDGRPVYYARSAILIDMDDPAIIYINYNGRSNPSYTVCRIPIEPLEKKPSYSDCRQRYCDDSNYLFTYYSDDDNVFLTGEGQVCITLRLPDGSEWISTDLTNPDTGEEYDLYEFYSSGLEYNKPEY